MMEVNTEPTEMESQQGNTGNPPISTPNNNITWSNDSSLYRPNNNNYALETNFNLGSGIYQDISYNNNILVDYDVTELKALLESWQLGELLDSFVRKYFFNYFYKIAIF